MIGLKIAATGAVLSFAVIFFAVAIGKDAIGKDASDSVIYLGILASILSSLAVVAGLILSIWL